MASLAMAVPSVAHGRPFGATLAIVAKETKYEFLKLLRNRTFTLATIGFPVMFYAFFGLTNRTHDGGVAMAKYMLGGYACFGLIGAALFGIGVGLSTERTAGWLELKRTSPMPALAYLVAKCITAQAFGLVIVGVLCALGIGFGGVQLSVREFAMMLGVAFVGSIPFAALGLLIALVAPPQATAGIVNLIYLPMSFLSGLWIPLRMLPKALQVVAPSMPTYHLSQLMLRVYGYQNQTSLMSHVVGLCGFTLVTLGACWAVFQRAEANA